MRSWRRVALVGVVGATGLAAVLAGAGLCVLLPRTLVCGEICAAVAGAFSVGGIAMVWGTRRLESGGGPWLVVAGGGLAALPGLAHAADIGFEAARSGQLPSWGSAWPLVATVVLLWPAVVAAAAPWIVRSCRPGGESGGSLPRSTLRRRVAARGLLVFTAILPAAAIATGRLSAAGRSGEPRVNGRPLGQRLGDPPGYVMHGWGPWYFGVENLEPSAAIVLARMIEAERSSAGRLYRAIWTSTWWLTPNGGDVLRLDWPWRHEQPILGQALDSLVHLGASAGPALPVLRVIVHERAPGWPSAVEALGNLGAAAADAGPDIVALAASLPPPVGLDVDGDSRPRTCARAIGRIGGVGTARALVEWMERPDPEARRCARELVEDVLREASRGGRAAEPPAPLLPELAAAMPRFVGDRDADARRWALDVLRAYPPLRTPAAEAAICDTWREAELRPAILDAMGWMSAAPEAVRTLRLAALGDPDYRIRRRAIDTVERGRDWPDRELRSMLQRLAESDPAWAVRRDARDCVGRWR